MASVTVLQGLRQAQVSQGTNVLINGDSGGVGAFAVQIAKAKGAEVTGVCSTGSVDFVRSLRAEAGQLKAVIDSRYPFAETAETLRRAETRHPKGKVIITI